MIRLPAFSSTRILHPCPRAFFPIRAVQSARILAASDRTGLQWTWRQPRRKSWGNFEHNGPRWTTVRPFASLQEKEKLGEEKKEVGLAEKEGEKTDSDAPTKPDMCTADELHYVPVPGTDWRLALWRYLPSKNVRSP